MIYTLTLNPSIDYYMSFDSVIPGQVNRSSQEHIAYGGKGINVSRMLKALGMESTAIALIAGDTGEALLSNLKREGLRVEPVYAKGNTRINVKLGDGTELNGSGCIADEATLTELNQVLCTLGRGDILVMSGSICKGLYVGIYARLVKELRERGVLCIVDTSGKALAKAIGAKPYLIKPNIDELRELFSAEREITERPEAMAEALNKKGVDRVLLSLGDKGALLSSSEGISYCPAPVVKAVNTVAAGDCMLAGYIYGMLKDINPLRLAVACGSSRVMCKDSFPTRNMVMELYNEIKNI